MMNTGQRLGQLAWHEALNVAYHWSLSRTPEAMSAREQIDKYIYADFVRTAITGQKVASDDESISDMMKSDPNAQPDVSIADIGGAGALSILDDYSAAKASKTSGQRDEDGPSVAVVTHK